VAYQAKALHNSADNSPQSRLDSLNAPNDVPKPGEQATKMAHDLATRLLYGIDALLNEEKVAHTLPMKNNPLAKLAMEKEASRRAGEDFAEAYLQKLLTKSATDTIGELQPALAAAEGRGDISKATRDAIVDKVSTSLEDIQDTSLPAMIKKKIDPHAASENKSPEPDPVQPVTQVTPPDSAGKGEGLVNKPLDQQEAVKAAADMMVAKAALYEDLMKAAQLGDDAGVAVAKSNIVDFLNSVYGG